MILFNTEGKSPKEQNPFFPDGEAMLLQLLISYLHYYIDYQSQNFAIIMKLLSVVATDGCDDNSPLDMLMKVVREHEGSEALTVRIYDAYIKCYGLKCREIAKSLSIRMQLFNFKDVADLLDTDNIGFERMGDEKTALFIRLPLCESAYNVIAVMMLTQVISSLIRYAENEAFYSQVVYDNNGRAVKAFRADDEAALPEAEKKAEAYLAGVDGGYAKQNSSHRLPVHVRFIISELPQVGRIPDFGLFLITNARRNMSVMYSTETMIQLMKMYGRRSVDMLTACDTFVRSGDCDVCFEKENLEAKFFENKFLGARGYAIARSLKFDECLVLTYEKEPFKDKMLR